MTSAGQEGELLTPVRAVPVTHLGGSLNLSPALLLFRTESPAPGWWAASWQLRRCCCMEDAAPRAHRPRPIMTGGLSALISSWHSFAKLITKCMANRLAPKLDVLVSRNQSAFIKGRSIHDNFRLVRLSCKEMHAKRARSVLLKIDVAKAFDTVAWPFLLEVLEYTGFGRRWRDWIALLFGTANTKILLNGEPGRRICHARGLRQGDPLSPMLFVLAMEVFNRAIQWLDTQNMLTSLGPAGGAAR